VAARSFAKGILIVRLTFLFLVMTAHSALSQQPTVSRIAGCYDLVVGDWSRPLLADKDFHSIPASIRLDTARVLGGGRAVTPDIAWPVGRPMRGSPQWTIVGDTVRIVWSNGFSPTVLRLRQTGAHLTGWAEATSDAIPVGNPNWPRADVLADRISCHSAHPAHLGRAIKTSEALDSLRAGRLRWVRAGVGEYQLQSRVDCACGYIPEAMLNRLPLLTVRNGSIVARAKGKPETFPSAAVTIEGLFDEVEKDTQVSGRNIDRLALHPVYGFPIRYEAHGSSRYPADWTHISVDSFAVIRPSP